MIHNFELHKFFHSPCKKRASQVLPVQKSCEMCKFGWKVRKNWWRHLWMGPKMMCEKYNYNQWTCVVQCQVCCSFYSYNDFAKPGPILILEILRELNKKFIVNQPEYFVVETIHIVLCENIYRRETCLTKLELENACTWDPWLVWSQLVQFPVHIMQFVNWTK